MSNVVSLSIPNARLRSADQIAAVAQCFASHRRHQDDVFWLKENAEFLNVLETAKHPHAEQALAAYAPVYATLPERLAFFPQYYRFLLSICMDIEDIGMDGTVGQDLVAQVLEMGLPGTELSDLQRAEAGRLLARRGACAGPLDAGLKDRLRHFTAQTRAFAVPNKRLAYELTHIVFYLSEYGRSDPDLPDAALASLSCAGILARLENNMDLLAEVCIALRFAGQTPPAPWEAALYHTATRFVVDEDDAPAADDYHAYLMTHWHGFLSGRVGFSGAVQPGRMGFSAPPEPAQNLLRDLSEYLYDMGAERCGDWGRMRARLANDLPPHAFHRLDAISAEVSDFERFFEVFARAAQPSTQPCAIG